MTNSIQNSLIQSVSSSVAQSTINGDSFIESLNNSMQNLLINAAGEMGANEIENLVLCEAASENLCFFIKLFSLSPLRPPSPFSPHQTPS